MLLFVHMHPSSHRSFRHERALLIILVAGSAIWSCPCDPKQEDPKNTNVGGTESAPQAPPVAGGTAGDGNADGVDETASPTPPWMFRCRLDKDEGAPDLMRYQCAGELEAKLAMTIDTPNGLMPREFPSSRRFGHGETGDEYADPLVMACCDEYQGPMCAEHHQQTCYYDLVEQLCQGLVKRIQKYVNEELEDDEAVPAIARPTARTELIELSNWIATNQEECIERFITDTGVRDADSCNAGNQSTIGYSGLLANQSWSIPNSDEWKHLQNISATIDSAEITGLYPAAGESPDACNSIEDNNDVEFIEYTPPPSTGFTAAQPAEVVFSGNLSPREPGNAP